MEPTGIAVDPSSFGDIDVSSVECFSPPPGDPNENVIYCREVVVETTGDDLLDLMTHEGLHQFRPGWQDAYDEHGHPLPETPAWWGSVCQQTLGQ